MTSGRTPGQRQASKSHSVGPRVAGGRCMCLCGLRGPSIPPFGRGLPSACCGAGAGTRPGQTALWGGRAPVERALHRRSPPVPPPSCHPTSDLPFAWFGPSFPRLQSGSEPPWDGALCPSLFRPPRALSAGQPERVSRRRGQGPPHPVISCGPPERPFPQCFQRPPFEAQGGPSPPFPRPLSSASLASVPAGSPPRCPAASANHRGRQPTWKVRVSPWPAGVSVGADGSAWQDPPAALTSVCFPPPPPFCPSSLPPHCHPQGFERLLGSCVAL